MTVWVLSDLHLAFGAPEKNMEIFGRSWQKYTEKIHSQWHQIVNPRDLVLIPGDISWALQLEKALIDLNWIDALPGTKLLLKGNHDYWWPSNAKLTAVLPPSVHFIHNNAFHWGEVTIGGSRLWDSPEFSFDDYIDFTSNTVASPKEKKNREKIYKRELERLTLSLKQLSSTARYRIAMTHYPPIGADLKESSAAAILESYQIDICTFGHLHNVKKNKSLFGEKNGIRYVFAAADYLAFKPLQLLP